MLNRSVPGCSGAPAGGGRGPDWRVVCRGGDRQHRWSAARCHRRGFQPGADRRHPHCVHPTGAGRYTIVDLRPGPYTLTFTLPGFSTVIREELQPLRGLHDDHRRRAADRRARGDGDRVGGRRRWSTCRRMRGPRCSIARSSTPCPPATRCSRRGQLIVGIKLNRPEVGLTTATQQTFMSVHGMSPSQVTVQVDGLNVKLHRGRRRHPELPQPPGKRGDGVRDQRHDGRDLGRRGARQHGAAPGRQHGQRGSSTSGAASTRSRRTGSRHSSRGRSSGGVAGARGHSGACTI